MFKRILLLLMFLSSNAFAFVEFKTSFYGSFLSFGRSDLILSTHNTILFGSENIKFGGFYSFESYQSNTTDTAIGGAFRVGESTFLELQGGAYQRKFEAHSTLKGKGIMGNIIIGKHFGDYFGLSFMLIGKKITSGMDKRLIVKALPYFSLRVGF